MIQSPVLQLINPLCQRLLCFLIYLQGHKYFLNHHQVFLRWSEPNPQLELLVYLFLDRSNMVLRCLIVWPILLVQFPWTTLSFLGKHQRLFFCVEQSLQYFEYWISNTDHDYIMLFSQYTFLKLLRKLTD